MTKKSRKRQRSEYVEIVDEATSAKQSCLHDSNEVETFESQNLLKLQYEAESLMPASGSGDYCAEKILSFMYKLDVSTWCYLKRRAGKEKLMGVGLTVDNTDVDKFSDIVISQNDELIHVNVNYTVSPFADKFITYLDLFGTKSPYSLNNYFNSWVSHELSKQRSQSSKIKYLVVFCNDKLQLSADNKLTWCSSKYSYPFQFESVDICQIPLLQDILVTNTSRKFYKFATDDLTIDEFCQRLTLSNKNKKMFIKKSLTSEFEKDLKKSFLTKLIFLDNQPCRESFKKMLIDEIKQYGKDYIKLQNILVKYTSISKKSTWNEHFKLILSILNDMFIHMKISAVSIKSYRTSNVINILYKRKITYLINLDSANNASISYDDFFPWKKKEKSKFSLNELYTFFRNEYKRNSNIKFFVIHTYSELNLTYNNIIKNNKSEQYCPLKLNNIDVTKKRYKIFQSCTALNKSKLFEFASEDYSAVSKLINYTDSIEQEIDAEEEEHIKFLFLHTLIIATGQTKISDIKGNNQQELRYTLDQLQEIALRWIENQKHQIMTPRNMRLTLSDIENNRSSALNLNYLDFSDEWRLSRALCRTLPNLRNEIFYYFITGKGKIFVKHFKNAGIDLRSVGNSLQRSLTKYNIYIAFEELHNFWFDEKGNKTKNALILEKNHMSSKTVLYVAINCNIRPAITIRSLFDLWFDKHGNKTKYLCSLEMVGIDFSILVAIIKSCGLDSRLAHENIYNLLFDEKGNKTKYAINFEKNDLYLSKIAYIVFGGGISAAQILKDLHDLWFDADGNQTKYLLNLKKHNIDFHRFIPALYGSKNQAVCLYKKMYYTLFDQDGNPTENLQNLNNVGIKFSTMARLLQGARTNIVKVINEVCNLFFDKDGNKTKYLKTFDNHNINVDDICRILWGVSTKASILFQDLYNFLFDDVGEKRKILRTFENYGISINQLAKMIANSNIHAVKLLNDLYKLWFDENGNKSNYIKDFENVNIDLIKILNILKNSHSGAVSYFKALYDFFIDANGMESFHLSTLKKHEISVDIFMIFLRGTIIDHVEIFNRVFYTFFDKEGNKTQFLSNFESKGVDLQLLSALFTKSKNKGIQRFHDLFFDETGQNSEVLNVLEKKNVFLIDVCNIFLSASSNTPLYFKMLFDLWFDEDFKETQYLQELERNGIPLPWLCQLLKSSGIYSPNAFKAIHKLFIDEDGSASLILRTVIKYINLEKLLHIYSRGGLNFPTSFPKLYNCWFDENGEKTHFLQTMEQHNFDINLLCDLVKNRSGSAGYTFQALYKLFFDPEGNPSLYITNYLNNRAIIKSFSKIIRGTQETTMVSIKTLYGLWFKLDGRKTIYLLTLENYGVDIVTIHGIFIGVSKVQIKPFRNLFKCMFKSTSKPTESAHLKSLLGIGFTVNDIISVLRKSGPNAARNFMNLYYLFFDEQGQMTKYAEVLTQNQVDIASFVRDLNVKNGNKFVDNFKSAYGLYYDENGVKIDVINDSKYI